MVDTLHFTLPQDRLHPAFNAFDLALAERTQGSDEGGFQLAIANRIWAQEGYLFLPEYLDTLAINYGAGLALLDFMSDPEASRITINDWVSDQTEDRIKDLIPPDAIDDMTRFVLTNAVYFNADWQAPFDGNLTWPEPFYLTDGSTVTANMMRQTGHFGYGEGADYQAVQLPYVGGQVAMVILLPAEGSLDAFAQSLGQGGLAAILTQLDGTQYISLRLPSFTFESSFELKTELTQLGMVDAFAPSADFSGMNGRRNLSIGEVIHKAFVKVDEKGTEAAAATAVVGMDGSAEPASIEMVVNRPFLFLIRDVPTNAILFMGKVANPS